MLREIHEASGGPVTVEISGLTDVELQELERIKDTSETGALLPASVVDAASDPESPLHRHFEWNNTRASHEYRLWQARQLIACVQVTYPDREPVRYFPHVRTEKHGYRAITEVLTSESLKKSYLEQFVRDIESLISKYRAIAVLSGSLKTLEKLVSRLRQK